MNVITVAQDYVMRMLSSKSAAGMKVLLMDKETAGIVSLVVNQSTALQKEVYLFERIDNPKREALLHLRCIAFLRPTQENLRLLAAELADPKYREYHLFFSNTTTRGALEELAQADEHRVVIQVQEFFADFFAINPDFYTLYTSHPAMTAQEEGWLDTERRIVDGILSVMLAMKRRPIIRYSAGSETCQTVTKDIIRRMKIDQDLFDYRRTDPLPLLLILDRRDDPVSPLLFQWTYQAMVHEVFGLVKNRVDFSSAPSSDGAAKPADKKRKDELKEAVLSCEQDSFFKDTMYMDFGELGEAVKNLLEQYQQQSKGNESIKSLEDIRRFLDRYPEFRKMGASASKHVALMDEISKYIHAHKMMDVVGKFEQELACHQDPANASRQLYEAIDMPDLPAVDKLHLAMLYALRYETEVNMVELRERLIRNGVAAEEAGKLETLLRYSNSRNRGVDLYSNSTIWSRAASQVKRGIMGVQNIYQEHTPYLVSIIDAATKGKLKDSQFPLIIESLPPPGAGQTQASVAAAAASLKVNEIIIFIVGGATFEEAYHVARINNTPSTTNPVRVILGGNTILNTKIFLQNLGATKVV